MENNTLNEALKNLGELMATNLSAMGALSANASDGLTTLAGKILDVEPSRYISFIQNYKGGRIF